MNPRLVAVAGPLSGSVFVLADQEFSIGREQSNCLCLADLSVSRRHCLIQAEVGQFKICDLGSHNGTFVNAVPVKERLLQENDQIKIGQSLFVFLTQEGETHRPASTVQFEEVTITGLTVRLEMEDALYLKPEKILAALPAPMRMARDLSALMKISTVINSIRSLEALQRQLLDFVFDVVPAERGAIILLSAGLEGFSSISAWNKLPAPNQPIQVSRTVVDRVIREGVAILSNDILSDSAFSTAESLVTSRVQSLLVVPLIVFQNKLGVIYLDTSNQAIRFDEEHLQLVTAIASIAAVALENARHFEWLESEIQRLKAEINIEHDMVGETSRMREIYQFIAKVAPTESTVLITGESGTGKELVARAIHRNSPRATKAFLAINCATLTETLLESELFGHEKGAFTGAIAQKKGKLEVADGGTIFLDEVAELAPVLQAKLLRVLQEREFERVGGTRPIKVDVRLIAATNKDLGEAIREGAFRQDLYYRLNVVSLVMPPLRERREDIPLLASYFTARYSKRSNRETLRISAEAQTCMMNYEWPGNIRELENAIERAVVLCSSDMIRPEDLPEAVLETEPATNTSVTQYHDAINETKKQVILKALEQAGGNFTEAAKLLGVHRNYLHRLMRNMKLKTPQEK